MELLPSLALHQVLTYLDTADLLACSLVNIKWRSVVNCDYIWKRICYKQSNKCTIHHLREVYPAVSPIFEVPELTSLRLEPLCYWRVMYMKLQHVNRNWQKSNHETYSITTLAYNYFDLKINNDLLIANVNDIEFEVWNIRGVPYKQETITCALKDTRCKCMTHICEDRLVIVQDTMLQLYCRSSPTQKRFELRYRRLFNQPEIASKNIPNSLNIDDWYSDLVKRRPTHLQAFYVGKYFIGLAQNSTFESASFHVWDMVSGSKLKEESVKGINPNIHDPVHNVKFCPPKTGLDKILVCVQHSRQTGNFGDDVYYTLIYVYDLSTQTFKKFKVLRPHVPWIYFEDRLILTIGHSQAKLSIYDSSNGEKLISKRYEEVINPDSVQVHGDYLGFTTGGDLVVLSVKDFDLVFTTGVIKFSSNLFGFDFLFLDWNLVLITSWDVENKIEVWSISEQCQLSTLGTSGLLFPCNNYAKFFVWNEMLTTIYMLQFW